MTAKVYRSLGWVFLTYLCMGATCIQCEEREQGLVYPEDAEEVDSAEGTIIRTKYDNPLLRGFFLVDLSGIEITREPSASPLYDETETYTHSSAPLFSVAGQEQYGWLDVARGDIDLEHEFRALGPNISLPSDGTSVPIELFVARPGSGAGGISRESIGSARYALDPSVLVLPVDVTVFASSTGVVPYIAAGDSELVEALVRQKFDATGAHASGSVSGDAITVTASELDKLSHVSPDALWYQCGIQFRLNRVTIMPQSDGLESTLVNNTAPCRSGNFALADYIPTTLEAAGAIPVFVGGTIQITLLDDYFGITCPPNSPFEYIAVEGREFLTSGISAHELGHFVGLDHESEATNLMTPPNASGIAGTALTETQCERARCDAAKLLRRWSHIDQARENEVCEPFLARCGDGVRETGEQCDDGNNVPGDGCRADCTAERCGDGIVDVGEACDYGADPENCTFECEVCIGCSVCGNGVVDPGEQCDPPNESENCDDTCHWILQ